MPEFKRLAGLDLKHKVIFAFVFMLFLVALGMGYMLYNLDNIVKRGNDVILLQQPAAIDSLKLISEVNFTQSLLNNYLLTGDTKVKKDFYKHKQNISNMFESLKNNEVVNKGDNRLLIKKINVMLNDYYSFSEKLFHLRDNDLENYPGLAMASELTDPYTLAYLGTLNEAIDSGLENVPQAKRVRVIKGLEELRYTWIQMNNAFRIFMTTRRDDDLKNFYSYSAANDSAMQKLKKLKVDIGFDTIENLDRDKNERMLNVPKVAKVFQNEAWRQDVYISRTQVNPLLENITKALGAFVDNQIRISRQHENELASKLRHTYLYAGFIMAFGIMLAVFVGWLVLRSIKPISILTGSVNKFSLDNLEPVEEYLSGRDDEVGRLAKSFNEVMKHLKEDIRERKIVEKKFEYLLESLSDATIIVDTNGCIKLFNKQAENLFGYQKSEIVNCDFDILIPDRFRIKHAQHLNNYMQAPKLMALGRNEDLFGLCRNGSEVPVEISLSPIETSDGLLISAAIRDVSERKENEKILVYQANYDSLTGLPNRSLAMDRLSHAIASARRKQTSIAVIFVDLDNFKQINDSLGHSVGDKLLQKVSQRLSLCTRGNDTIARLGGDEFLIIITDVAETYRFDVIVQKIIDSIGHHYEIDNRELYIGASAGIAIFPSDGDEPEILLRNADAAMYQSKKSGRNTYRYFTAEMNEALLARMEYETCLRNAIQNNELSLVYQPIYDVQDKQIAGIEALLRWETPGLGKVDPEIFIPIAEDSGQIGKIGQWVLMQACMAAKSWEIRTGKALRVSVNISPAQFRGGDLVNIVKTTLEATGLAASQLELELTERVLVEDNPNVNRILMDIKRFGVRLSLDDFGTGYSSLGYLKRFRFDVLKIDRLFISDIAINPETKSLCHAIYSMANSLHMEVVAEGVETQEQLRILQDMDINLIQGYLLSRPVTDDEILNLMNKKNALLRSV